MKVLICGAGIIGLTIANECLNQNHEVVVIDKETVPGRHASGRNSGVLHSGIYYPKDTLKSAFCREGIPLFQSFCSTHGIEIDTCGKLLVAKTQSELETLALLFERGIDNGIMVEKLSEAQLAKKAPYAKTVDTALWVEQTAVFDPNELLNRLIDLIDAHPKGRMCLGESFKCKIDETTIQTNQATHAFDVFINCAGGHSDKIAHHFGVGRHLTLIPFKGIYKQLNPSLAKELNHHIYPLPDLENPFLGVHFTKSKHGGVYVGPTAIPAFGPENYGLFENMAMQSLNILYKDAVLFLKNKKFRRVACSEPKRYIHRWFYNEAKQLVQHLRPEDLMPSQKIGIRPQLVDWTTKELVMDFMIEKKDNHIHILNAISPAFSCCFSFAKHVVDHIKASVQTKSRIE